MARILCIFGWHRFRWSLKDLGPGENGAPPEESKCERCGVTYGKNG